MNTFDAEKSFSGRGSISNELSSIRQAADQHVFMTGVVVEYLSSPSTLNDTIIERLVGMGASQDALNSAPPNSLAVMPTTGGQAHTMNKIVVCYPFFSHFCMPVKPGEMVWYTTGESETTTSGLVCWWMSRVVLPEHCEDNNYAHHDRQFWDREETSYPNGPGSGQARTLPEGDDAFDIIVQNSFSINNFVPTASPRPVSNPNKSFIAGSHRNVINLDVYDESGFVEIVAGLPRPTTRLSSRGWEEVDHADVNVDPPENTSSFLDSQARLFVAENIEFAESMFGLEDENWSEGFSGKETTASSLGVIGAWSNDTIFASGLRALRLDGGDTLLHMQGGQLAIKTANFLVKADKVVLLQNADANLFIGGDSSTEPIVLGDRLSSWQNGLLDVLDSMLDMLNTAVIPSPVGPLPFSGATTSSGTVGVNIAGIKQNINLLRNNIPKHLSSMAFINDSSKGD
jgi:hypothetical protein